MTKVFENHYWKVLKMKENFKTGYIFQAKIPKPVEDRVFVGTSKWKSSGG